MFHSLKKNPYSFSPLPTTETVEAIAVIPAIKKI
jgi:hypothetical protein